MRRTLILFPTFIILLAVACGNDDDVSDVATADAGADATTLKDTGPSGEPDGTTDASTNPPTHRAMPRMALSRIPSFRRSPCGRGSLAVRARSTESARSRVSLFPIAWQR